jgi:hypothetical protein
VDYLKINLNYIKTYKPKTRKHSDVSTHTPTNTQSILESCLADTALIQVH